MPVERCAGAVAARMKRKANVRNRRFIVVSMGENGRMKVNVRNLKRVYKRAAWGAYPLITWESPGITWESPGNHLGVTWNITWESPGSHLGVTWDLPGSHLGITWESPGDHLGITWESPGNHLGVAWEDSPSGDPPALHVYPLSPCSCQPVWQRAAVGIGKSRAF